MQYPIVQRNRGGSNPSLLRLRPHVKVPFGGTTVPPSTVEVLLKTFGNIRLVENLTLARRGPADLYEHPQPKETYEERVTPGLGQEERGRP